MGGSDKEYGWRVLAYSAYHSHHGCGWAAGIRVRIGRETDHGAHQETVEGDEIAQERFRYTSKTGDTHIGPCSKGGDPPDCAKSIHPTRRSDRMGFSSEGFTD